MFKRTWQVVFWDARNISGIPKQFAEIFPSEVGKSMPSILYKSLSRNDKNITLFATFAPKLI